MGVFMLLVSVSFRINKMDVLKATVFFIYVVVLFDGSYCDDCKKDITDKPAAIILANDLFCSYDPNVRPVKNQAKQIIVYTSIFISNINLAEEWDVLQMGIQLIMEWKDEFLVWDSTKYDNIEKIFRDSSSVWLPHVMSYDMGYNGADNRDYSYILPKSMVKITSDGIVKYNHRLTLTTECSTNIAEWPFDSHSCTFYIGSPMYTNKYVNFSFPFGYYNMSYYNHNREWAIDNIKHKCENYLDEVNSKVNNTHCVLEYEIKIVRFSAMYYSSVIIPAVVISLMRNFTFLMGREVSLRIIFLCLFFISELLYIQFLDVKLPNNGVHPVYIVTLYRNSLILTAMACVITVISNELYKKSTADFPCNAPGWIKSLSTFILKKRPLNMLTNFNIQGADLLIEKNIEEDTRINNQRDENALIWKTLFILLDRLSFIITLIISLFNFLFFIP